MQPDIPTPAELRQEREAITPAVQEAIAAIVFAMRDGEPRRTATGDRYLVSIVPDSKLWPAIKHHFRAKGWDVTFHPGQRDEYTDLVERR